MPQKKTGLEILEWKNSIMDIKNLVDGHKRTLETAVERTNGVRGH